MYWFYCDMNVIDSDPCSFWQPCYMFSKPLKEVEWNMLQGYTCYIQYIQGFSLKITQETIRMAFSHAPFEDPLFLHLWSLYWSGTTTFVLLHVAIPLLKALYLYLNLDYLLLPTIKEFFDFAGDCCPHIEDLVIYHDYYSSGPMDSMISHAVYCCISKLTLILF